MADIAVDGEIGRVIVDFANVVELEVRPEALAVFVEDLIGDEVLAGGSIRGVPFADYRPPSQAGSEGV